MKLMMKLLVLLFGVLMLTSIANAESPREQLKQMVEQLQKNPADTALREKIIKLAQEIKPAPVVPEEAERHMAYGTAAFTGAKSLADYKESVKEFEQVTLAAPWYGDAYFNLGVAQDKAENYEAALRSLNLARLALPDSKDIKALIYQVEYRNKKANSPQAQMTKEKENAAKKLAGVWAIADEDKDEGPGRLRGTLRATWNVRESGSNKIAMTPLMTASFDPDRRVWYVVPANNNSGFRLDGTVDGITIRGKILLFGYHCPDHEYEVQGEVLRDGQVLVLRFYQDYIQNVEGAEGTNCGRKDTKRNIYLYRQGR